MPKFYKRVRVEYTFYSDAIEADTESKAEAIAVDQAVYPSFAQELITDVETYDPKDFE